MVDNLINIVKYLNANVFNNAIISSIIAGAFLSIFAFLWKRQKYINIYTGGIFFKPVFLLKLNDFLGRDRLKYPNFYYERKRISKKKDIIIKKLNKGRNVLIYGESLVGKTQIAYECVKKMGLLSRVTLFKVNMIDGIRDNFLFKLPRIFFLKHIIFIDDIHLYSNSKDLEYLLEIAEHKNVVIIATSHEKKKHEMHLGEIRKDFSSVFFEITIPIMDEEERADFSKAIEKYNTEIINKDKQLKYSSEKCNGTIGSVTLNLEEMKKRYDAIKREDENSALLLQAIHILYDGGIHRNNKYLIGDIKKVYSLYEDKEVLDKNGREIDRTINKLSRDFFGRTVRKGNMIDVEEAYCAMIFDYPTDDENIKISIFMNLFKAFCSNDKKLLSICRNVLQQKEAVSILEKYNKNKKNNSIILFYLGVAYREAEMWKNGIDILKICHDLQPLDYDTCIYLGICYRENREYENAINILKDAIKINPANSNAYLSLGITYYDDKQYRESITQLEIAMRLSPEDEIAVQYFLLACLEGKNLGKFQKLILENPKLYKKIIEETGGIDTNIEALQDMNKEDADELKQIPGLKYMLGFGKDHFHILKKISEVNMEEDMEKRGILIKDLLRDNPKSSQINFLWASFSKEIRKDFDGAEKYYKKALEFEPDNPLFNFEYASFLQNMRKDFDGAEKYYKKALEIEPSEIFFNNAYALFLKDIREDFDGAEEYYKKALEINLEDSIVNYNYALFLQNIRKDLDSADKYYKKALEFDPGNINFNIRYALFLKDIRKDFDGADKYYKKAIDLDPKNAQFNNNYALFLRDIRKDFDGAEKYYKKSLELEPENPQLNNSYAIFLLNIRKDFDGAEKYYKKALEIDSAETVISTNYALFLKDIRKDFDGAEKYYKKILELDPKNAQFNDNYASFLKNIRKDFDGAEKYYKKALEINPEDAVINNNYALFLQNIRKDFDGAKNYYKKSLRINPKESIVRNNYILFLKNNNNK